MGTVSYDRKYKELQLDHIRHLHFLVVVFLQKMQWPVPHEKRMVPTPTWAQINESLRFPYAASSCQQESDVLLAYEHWYLLLWDQYLSLPSSILNFLFYCFGCLESWWKSACEKLGLSRLCNLSLNKVFGLVRDKFVEHCEAQTFQYTEWENSVMLERKSALSVWRLPCMWSWQNVDHLRPLVWTWLGYLWTFWWADKRTLKFLEHTAVSLW